MRSFPLIRAFDAKVHDPKLFPIIRSLHFLFLGREYRSNDNESLANVSPSTAQRAISSLQSRIAGQSCISSHSNEFYQDIGDWLIVSEVLPYLFRSPEVSEARGAFRPLDASKIDLPSHPIRNSQGSWIHNLSSDASKLLSQDGFSTFADSLLKAFGLSQVSGKLSIKVQQQTTSLPQSRVFSLPGHYEKVLDKADRAGMLQWTAFSTESKALSRLVEGITMTSFAVSKTGTKDRLISWPRIQNMLLPNPPKVNLPNPEMFTRLRISNRGKLQGLFFDVDNMYHNISLPSHLVNLFPLTKVRYGNLSGSLQRKLAHTFGFRPRQDEFVRPFQATLPMGFKWAVYIAHSLANSCIRQGTSLFMRLAATRYDFHFGMIHFTQSNACIRRIEKGDGAFFHIIDDVNFVADGWPREAVIFLHRCLLLHFQKNGLPFKAAKSLPIGQVEVNSLPFIGWNWNLKTGIITAQERRLSEAISDVREVLDSKTHNPRAFERSVGRLIWQTLGHRPLLSTLSTVFRVQSLTEKPIRLNPLLASARKELSICATLVPLVCIDVHRPYCTKVVCFDASLAAGAVVSCTATSSELETLLSLWHQHAASTSLSTKLKYLAYVRSFVKRKVWHTALTHTWRRMEHINGLEAEAYVLALQWIASHQVVGQRILFLSDSKVVIGAMTKGRLTIS